MRFRFPYLFILIVSAQIYFPRIYIFETTLSIDLLLVLLTIYAFQYKRTYCIIIGFLFGICQDMISQANLIGAFAMAKSISGYALGSLNSFDKIWMKKIKYAYIFAIYMIHNSIYYYLKLFSVIEFLLAIKIIFIQSFVLLILLELVNVFIYNRKLIK